MPPSVTVNRNASSRTTSMASSSSSARNFMPVTPEVARPMGRSDSSDAVNRTDWPLRDTRIRSWSESTRRAETSSSGRPSSSSRRLIAMTPPDAVRVVVGQAGLLHQAALRGEHQVLGLGVVADVEHLGDLLARLERQQVGDVLALGVAAALGQLVRLGAVDAAEVGEEQQPVVRRRDEEVVDEVVLAQLRAAHALAAAPLRPVVVRPGPLGVAAAGDGDDHLLLGDEVLDADLAVERQDRRAPLVAVLRDDLGQLLGDDVALALLATSRIAWYSRISASSLA